MTTDLSPIHASPIAISVCCKDQLVRTGIAATLNVEPAFRVRVVEVPETAEVVHWSAMGTDVVIADYDTGLAIAQALRRKASPRIGSSTKVMIVSSRDGEIDVRRALEWGVQGYLPLGCHPNEMTDGLVALHRGQRCLGRTVTQRLADSFVYEALTSRELDVLSLVVAGDANKVVAKKLNIALGTVKVHVRSIMSKLGARTRTEAAAVARRRGLCAGDVNEGLPFCPRVIGNERSFIEADARMARTLQGNAVVGL